MCCDQNINLNFLTTPHCHPLFIERPEKLSLSRHTIFLHLDHIVHCTSSIGFIATMLNHSWTWLPLLLVLFKLSFTAIFSTSTLQKVTSCWHVSSYRSNVLISLLYLQFLKERNYSCPLEVNEYVTVWWRNKRMSQIECVTANPLF
jgi:ABC-type iron transport system FetAB permease component